MPVSAWREVLCRPSRIANASSLLNGSVIRRMAALMVLNICSNWASGISPTGIFTELLTELESGSRRFVPGVSARRLSTTTTEFMPACRCAALGSRIVVLTITSGIASASLVLTHVEHAEAGFIWWQVGQSESDEPGDEVGTKGVIDAGCATGRSWGSGRDEGDENAELLTGASNGSSFPMAFFKVGDERLGRFEIDMSDNGTLSGGLSTRSAAEWAVASGGGGLSEALVAHAEAVANCEASACSPFCQKRFSFLMNTGAALEVVDTCATTESDCGPPLDDDDDDEDAWLVVVAALVIVLVMSTNSRAFRPLLFFGTMLERSSSDCSTESRLARGSKSFEGWTVSEEERLTSSSLTPGTRRWDSGTKQGAIRLNLCGIIQVNDLLTLNSMLQQSSEFLVPNWDWSHVKTSNNRITQTRNW